MHPTPELTIPYKGLVPYAEEDAEFFFGREREQNLITANLLAERLTLLYGASGVGKSSVLRAGVEHHLRLLAQENLQRLGRPKYVVVVFNEWRESDPVRSLLLKVEEAIKLTLPTEEVELVDSSAGLTTALLEWSKRVRGQLLIILDQFEEYFLYHPNEDGAGSFAQEFPGAVNNLGLPANFLISFREDAFAKLTFFKVRMPDVFGNYLALEHLDHDAGRDAIQKPIDRYNIRLGNGNPPVSIEPALVEEVLKQVATGQVTVGETGRGTLKQNTTGAQIETPFLQMVMMRLWEDEISSGSRTLRLATLERLADEQTGESGAVRIVRTHLDKNMDALSPEQQDIAADVFHYLVTPSGTKIAHTVSDLAKYAELPEQQLAATLEELATGKMRILRAARSTDNKPRYEIFHDVLAAPILHWRSRHMAGRKLEEQRQEAERLAREEEKVNSARRLRWLAGVLAVMFVFAVVALIVALTQRLKATAALALAERSRIEEQEKSRLLKHTNEELEVAKKRADDQSAEAIKQSQLATNNEKKAKTEAAQARKDLHTAIGQLNGDLVNAERTYAEIPNNSRNDCDLKQFLEDSRTQYQRLLERYVTLRAAAETATCRRRIKEINGRLVPLKCDQAAPPPAEMSEALSSPAPMFYH